MRTYRVSLIALALAFAWPVPSARAAESRLKLDIGDLASRAKQVVDININKDTVEWAAKAAGEKGGNAAELRELMKDLDGVNVQVLEFEKSEAPAWKDMVELTKDILRKLDGPEWTPVVSVTERGKEGGEIVRVSLRKDASGGPGGLAIFVLEPSEIVVVDVNGRIRLDQLGRLGAALGAPGLLSGLPGVGPAPAKEKPAKDKTAKPKE